jgi:hypothetical protein
MRFLFIILSLSILFSCENQNQNDDLTDYEKLRESEKKLRNTLEETFITEHGFPRPPQSLKGIAYNLTEYKEQWIKFLMKKDTMYTYEQVKQDILQTINFAKTIDEGTIIHKTLYQKDSIGRFGFQCIPNYCQLRLIILSDYLDKYETTGEGYVFKRETAEFWTEENVKLLKLN